MKRIAAILFLASQCAFAGETNSDLPNGLFFSNISLSNDAVFVAMPLTRIRFLSFLNGTNAGFAGPSQMFVLKSGDKLELTEKHTTVTAIPVVTATNAELQVIQVFDARSFGGLVKTNIDTIQLK